MALQSIQILCSSPTRRPYTRSPLHCPIVPPSNPCLSLRTSHIVSATKKFSSRPGKFDSKNKKNPSSREPELTDEIGNEIGGPGALGTVDVSDNKVYDGYVLPKLPGDEPDFWEGPQWDAFGFFIQYLWAFGILFALISSGIAVATYNEGATDFKETPAFKESIQAQELLEVPEESNSDVFESNPTEEAPSLE